MLDVLEAQVISVQSQGKDLQCNVELSDVKLLLFHVGLNSASASFTVCIQK